jgi:uncharacterized protein
MKKFLCDEMCLELKKWLRTAGYDCMNGEFSINDQELYKKAVDEGRLLLTHDNHFKKIDPHGEHTFYLRGESLDMWAKQLKEEVGIDWLYRPFSRCIECNTLLEKSSEKYWFCPHCDHLFWLGSHTNRMMEQLKKWQET